MYCADVSPDDRFVAFGGPRIVTIYDVRNTASPLLNITESHSDDVYSLKFHPEQSNILYSGGLDGLINKFNLDFSNEDEAIEHGSSFDFFSY